MAWSSNVQTLRRNKYRYISFVLGFLFFVYPFGFLIRLVHYLQGTLAPPDLHRICFRMTVEGFFTGRYWYTLIERPIWAFVLVVLAIAFFLGPLFCGWLCPVGSLPESLSRQVPAKSKLYFGRKVNPASIRYGFLAAFILVPVLGLITYATPVIGLCCEPPAPGATGSPQNLAAQIGVASICCRFCASSVLQNIVTAITVDPSALTYWHEGSIIMLLFWLIIGGVFMVGGRGFCNFYCPLGAFSNIFHYIGAKLSFTYKILHDASKCTDCGRCEKICPMWSISRTASKSRAMINRNTCICCWECVKQCPQGCYSYSRGKTI